MTFRFLHASDLHLGRKFASIPQAADGNIRGRLMEARHGAIVRLGEIARDRGATHVLLAGDTFDTATPSPSIVRQALAAMGETPEATWWLLPGNHDNLRDAEPLWEMIRDTAPPNVRAVTEAAPCLMGDGAMLLPCPVAYRAGGSDPTEALVGMASDDGQLRIKFDLPKKVSWDQKQLAEIAERIVASGEKVEGYLDIKLSVSESRYTNWPPALQQQFAAARTVDSGKPAFTLSLDSEH